jgi:hypothetical protein
MKLRNSDMSYLKTGIDVIRNGKEKITAGIKPAEAEAPYPVSIHWLEEQRQLLRDILIEGNNFHPLA